MQKTQAVRQLTTFCCYFSSSRPKPPRQQPAVTLRDGDLIVCEEVHCFSVAMDGIDSNLSDQMYEPCVLEEFHL